MCEYKSGTGAAQRAFNIYAVSDMNVNNAVFKNIVSLNGLAYGIDGSPGMYNLKMHVEFEGLYIDVDLTMNELDYSAKSLCS